MADARTEGPYRSASRPPCPIAFCGACAAHIDTQCFGASLTRDELYDLLHGVQRASYRLGYARGRARRDLWLGLIGLLAVALVLATFAFCLRTAHAQDPDEQLALAVAKVAANEASLASIRPAEVALIWQVTEARGETSAQRLAWLRAHSSCVLGDGPIGEGRGNCHWTRGLSASARQPSGWPAHLPWARYAPRWAQVRELARRLVVGEESMRPCPGTPITWGGPMDHERALERGLVPLGCRDPQTGAPTRNEGFARAGGRS